jgi:hypothetical protein
MGNILRRALLPILAAIVGVGMLFYSAKVHRISVTEARESKKTIEFPMEMPQGPPQFSGGPPMDGFPPDGPPMGGPLPGEKPPMIKKTITVVQPVSLWELEPAIVRDVTVGGVQLLASGEIRRTYDSSSGKGPALCPT